MKKLTKAQIVWLEQQKQFIKALSLNVECCENSVKFERSNIELCRKDIIISTKRIQSDKKRMGLHKKAIAQAKIDVIDEVGKVKAKEFFKSIKPLA